MKCWEERPEDRPTFTQQLKDLSTILELTAEYMYCLAFRKSIVSIDPMPTTILSNDTVTESTIIATNNDLSSSEVSSGEEKDVIINPLCYSEDAPRDASVTTHTRGDVSPCDNDGGEYVSPCDVDEEM